MFQINVSYCFIIFGHFFLIYIKMNENGSISAGVAACHGSGPHHAPDGAQPPGRCLVAVGSGAAAAALQLETTGRAGSGSAGTARETGHSKKVLFCFVFRGVWEARHFFWCVFFFLVMLVLFDAFV